jgi:hypothetical protein
VNTLCGKRVLHAKDADDAANAHLEEGVRIKPITVGTWWYFLHSFCSPTADSISQSSSWMKRARESHSPLLIPLALEIRSTMKLPSARL